MNCCAIFVLYESSKTPIKAELAAALPKIKGDPTQLRQIIHNLIRNAQDATEGLVGAKIDVTATGNTPVPMITSDTARFP